MNPANGQRGPRRLTANRLRARLSPLLILVLLLLVACSGVLEEEQTPPSGPAAPIPTASGQTTGTENPKDAPSASTSDARINRRVDVPDDIDFPQYVPPDGILPIYEPQFVSAEEAPLKEDELVLAISIDGQAKAYPITVLRSREMVNDELAGIPILATW